MNIRERRTIRKYTQQPISDELLNRLLEEAARTQTMGNLQLYSVVVTRSDEMKRKLAPAHLLPGYYHLYAAADYRSIAVA